MKLSDEQKNVIDAPLGAMAVTACAGSGKTATAIRRLIAIRQKMKNSRGRVVLLSFSNVAVNTFNMGYQQLASALSDDDANRKRVEVDTLDGFFTKYILRPHSYRTMEANQAAYLVAGSEPFLSSFKYLRDSDFPLQITDIKVGIENGDLYFYSDFRGNLSTLDTDKALALVKRLAKTGAYTHDLGRYWIYQTLIKEPAVLRALAVRYPHLLVDESQDLGMLHQAILELLIKEGVQVSLIGDPNQGIYGFAGADGKFLSTYHERDGVANFKLTRNYRSLPPIINLANVLCGRVDEPDRAPELGGSYFIGYKDSQLPKLFTTFKGHIDELGIQHENSVILSRGSDRAAVLSGEISLSTKGLIAVFTKAALLRDQHGHYLGSFKLICRGIVSLLQNPPDNLSSLLLGAPQDGWVLKLRRLLWAFTRNDKTGLPSSALLAQSQWHPQLLEHIRILLTTIEKQFGLAAASTLGNKLAKRGLDDVPLIRAENADNQGPGIRVETIHQVKGESIDAVLYVAKKANIDALLAGTSSEEGRIGYVAVTRAKNLFWLAVPYSCLKALRPDLLEAGLEEFVTR